MFYGLGNSFEWAPTRIEVKSLFSEMECKFQHNLSQRRIENTTTCSNVDYIYMPFNWVIYMIPNLSMNLFTYLYVSTRGMRLMILIWGKFLHFKSYKSSK